MSESVHYDLLVLGAGSGNQIVDDAFSHLKVAFVERGRWGGTCLNRGCIPSKMLIHPADLAVAAVHGPEAGVHTSYDGADWPAIRDRVFDDLNAKSASGKEHRVEESFVDVLVGTAVFTGERALRVELNDGGSVEVTAETIVLAAGSEPIVPDIDGLHDVPHHTSDTIMRLETFPRRLGVLGGGYVGSELAHVFASLGSEVTQVDAADVLLGNQDREIAEVFTAEIKQRWDVRLETTADRFSARDGAAVMHLSDGTEVEVDCVLVATGRTPSSAALELDRTGVEVDDAGRVVVDEFQRTTAAGIWALGDMSSPEPLKHVANQDARTVNHNLTHPDDLHVSDHRAVPNAVFTDPQVAAVGLTEEQAREQGIDLAVGRFRYADIAHGWALLETDTDHLVKVLADRSTGLLVGAHLIGPQASVLVQTFITMMSTDLPVRGFARTQYWIHPSLTEIVENALIALEDDLG